MDKTIHKLKDNITILTEKHNYITNEIKEFLKNQIVIMQALQKVEEHINLFKGAEKDKLCKLYDTMKKLC